MCYPRQQCVSLWAFAQIFDFREVRLTICRTDSTCSWLWQIHWRAYICISFSGTKKNLQKKPQHIPIIISTLKTIKKNKKLLNSYSNVNFPNRDVLIRRELSAERSASSNYKLSSVCGCFVHHPLCFQWPRNSLRATSLDMNNCSVETKWLQNEP